MYDLLGWLFRKLFVPKAVKVKLLVALPLGSTVQYNHGYTIGYRRAKF